MESGFRSSKATRILRKVEGGGLKAGVRNKGLSPCLDRVIPRKKERKHLPQDKTTDATPAQEPGFGMSKKVKETFQRRIKDIGDVVTDGSGFSHGKAWASRGWESKFCCERKPES